MSTSHPSPGAPEPEASLSLSSTAEYDLAASETAEFLVPSEPKRLIRVLDRLPWTAAITLIVVGGLIAFGWLVPAEPLHHWLPGLRQIGPATALAFLVAGLALLLSRWSADGDHARLMARALALIVILLGVSKLVTSLAHIEPSLERVLFPAFRREVLPAEGTGLALNAAIGFVLAGCALWLMNSRGPWRQAPAQLFAIGSALLSLLALVASAYWMNDRSSVAAFIHMHLATALLFVLLSVGILVSRPNRGLMAVVTGPGPGGVMARRLLPACILIPTLLGWLQVLGEQGGYYGPTTGVSLLVVSNVVVVVGLIWVNAGLIDRMEHQRVAATDALRESEVFYHTLVETLPQNILRKDRTGHFTFVNRRFAETVGRPVEAIIGKTDADLFPHALAEKYRADDLQVMDDGSPFEVVEEHVTPDGQTHYVQVIKTPLRDASGAIIGVQGIFWDVTDRWRYEERLREQNERLAAMADSERRAHEELKQAQSRMVQTAKLAGLGEMVAGVAHEINNPLSYVGNNVAVLQRDLDEIRALVDLYAEADATLEAAAPELSRKIREFRDEADIAYTLGNLDGLLGRTRDGLKRIQRIVGDLRVFARLDEGDLDEVDLNAGIESTIGIVLGNAKKKQVEIRLDPAPLPPVTCFGTKINQVIMNLVSNAIDACDEGGHVVIATRAEPQGVRIEVRDDGCGIDPEVRDRIFDPFFTTKPVGVGTGLGLSISYGIVEDHGGTIEVDSAPGRGACFTVRLPSRVPSRPAPRAEAEPHAVETAPPTRSNPTESPA